MPTWRKSAKRLGITLASLVSDGGASESQPLAWWSLAGLVILCLVAACQMGPETAPAAATCAELVTPERVGAGMYEQLGLATRLQQGRFQHSESGGYVQCHSEDPETGAVRLTINYFFDGRTGALVLTHVAGWQAAAEGQDAGPGAQGRRCDSYLTRQIVGQGVFEHYDIAGKLQNDEFVDLASRGEYACITARQIGEVHIAGDELLFEFDHATGRLFFWRIHWREDLPATLPEPEVSQAEAYALVPGAMAHESELVLPAPDRTLSIDISPGKKPGPDDTYHHPCWLVWTHEGASYNTPCTTVIDAVTGEIVARECTP